MATTDKYKKVYTLLTGGSGYIGSAIAFYLLKMGQNVIIVDNMTNSSMSNMDNLPNKHNMLSFYIDCCNYEALENIFITYHISAVIHLAGLKAVAESVQKPLKYYENNLVSSLNILKLMGIYKIPKFIFSSSATVYGGQTSPLSEDTPAGMGITNPYGMTKYMIEQMIIDYAKIQTKTQFIILRYFNPVGTVENGTITENPADIPNNLMPVIVRSVIEKTPLKIFGSDYNTHDGTPARDYIHIEDLAMGHIKALEYTIPNANIDIFNLGTGNPYTVLDIIRTFERVNGVQLNYSLDDRRPGDLESVYCNPQKALRQLKWKATRCLEDMCDYRFIIK